MKPGPVSTALLWICWACQVHIIFGARPSRDFLRVLTTVDDRINRSQIDEWRNKNNKNQIESGQRGPDDDWDFDTGISDSDMSESADGKKSANNHENHIRKAPTTIGRKSKFDFDMKSAKNHRNHRSDPDDHPECLFQKQAAEQVLRKFHISFNESTTGNQDHCQYRGIRCGVGCEVIGVHLSWHREVVESEFESGAMGPWDDLIHLQDLNISGTRVRGNISAFKKMVNLSSVDLSNSMVEGNIGAFRRMRELKYLDLSQTQVFGDIRVFSSQKLKADGANMTKLWHLNLAHTKVSGDIQNFQHSSSLEYLNLQEIQASGDIEYLRLCHLKQILLRDSGVGGNIRVVQAFPDLTHLDLQNTLIFGDIGALEATQKLKSLSLGVTNARGDIAALRRTTDLEELDLSLTIISGDIQVFEHTKSLKKVALDRMHVEGDVQVFRHLPGLISLGLATTKVKGDISVFNATKSLLHLYVSDTQVSGDLQALKNSTTLKNLSLQNARVHGNLSALQDLDLYELDLSGTQIHGDIRVFENRMKLSVLDLSSTPVTGDVHVFHQCLGLSWLDLSFSNVTGDIQVFKNRSLQKLRLASTGVSGDLGELVCSCFENAFEVLDLSNTKVEGNIFVLQYAKALSELHLKGTYVAGSIDGLTFLEKAAFVDLSYTRVTGRLSQHWRGCCKHLRNLKLSGSRAHFLPNDANLHHLMDLRDGDQDALLPALTTLEVSECPLEGDLRFLIWPLAYCEYLASIIAVNSGLYGELPSLDPLAPIRINGIVRMGEPSKLASSLEVLEVSGNNLTLIESLPPSVRKLVISNNQKPLRWGKGTLTSALKRGVSIDLSGSKLDVENKREAEELLRTNVIRRTAEKTFSSRETDGYTCYNLEQKNIALQVLPCDFLPEELCACLPGWNGTGANCAQCPADTFKPEQGAGSCTRCPRNTTTWGKPGSKSKDDCQCQKAFRKHQSGKVLDKKVCDCEPGSAIFDGHCLECLPPLEQKRCKGGTLFQDHCGEGYHGRLRMQCEENYYATSGSCVRCTRVGLPSWLSKTMTWVCIVVLLAAFLVAIALLVYSRSPSQWLQEQTRAIFAPGPLGDWQHKLMKRQAPILLQMCQLWSVLSALVTRDDEASMRFWELPYMQHVQLALGNLREILYLQCFFDGKEVRKLLAFATPVAPLLLLLCCACVELRKPGLGVYAALKILTLFFVGGASKCAALISCQRVDAGGYPLRDHFLRQLPDLDCSHDRMVPPEVAAVFWPCAVCYAILIPCFLFFLYVRQHLVLRYTRMPLELSSGSKSEPLAVSHEDQALQRRLLAGLVAYVAMLQRGSVLVQVRDGNWTVAFFEPNGTALELDAEAIMAQFKIESEKLRHHSITEMLLERFTLDEQVREGDRFLRGARETLQKYSTCRDSWMELMMKLVTVAIVQAVASSTATNNPLIPMCKVLAAVLAVAATVWSVQPYAQPQVNDLQVVCFLGLALATAGFGYHNVFLSRFALLMPMVLAAAQQMQPDSPESLAQRLWEALMKNGMPTESATTSILTKRQSQEISFKLERD